MHFDSISRGRNTFMGELDSLLGRSFEEFSALDNFERTGFVLGCEKWDRSNFKALLSLVKNFVLSTYFTTCSTLYTVQLIAIKDLVT